MHLNRNCTSCICSIRKAYFHFSPIKKQANPFLLKKRIGNPYVEFAILSFHIDHYRLVRTQNQSFFQLHRPGAMEYHSVQVVYLNSLYSQSILHYIKSLCRYKSLKFIQRLTRNNHISILHRRCAASRAFRGIPADPARRRRPETPGWGAHSRCARRCSPVPFSAAGRPAAGCCPAWRSPDRG